MSSLRTGDAAPIKVKKYANRRLYNTATSSYVTLDHLSQMVKNGQQFVVEDAKTHEDITRSVLTQIIVEEESKGHHLLPISFLRQLISLYGDNLQWMVPNYLEYSMQVFSRNQEQIRQYFQEAMTGLFPFGTIEEVGKQQMAMFERALKIFSPFPDELPSSGESASQQRRVETREAAADLPQPEHSPGSDQSIEDLQKRLEELEAHLEDLGKNALNLGERPPETRGTTPAGGENE
ncbi:MAG: polyhydroxyalkanoate synthesis repressor PhaR [Alphaproteobacteria bacterium]|jgi:polyhydroxyalkanoate synthesis repressor PhaR|nr:polyhydroxyalkanoate synthesis repressor PhaR [Alphaproteobacteria bacterium]